jgi:hypothetical protein
MVSALKSAAGTKNLELLRGGQTAENSARQEGRPRMAPTGRKVSVHPEMDGQQFLPSIIWSRYGTRTKNLTAGIWLIFRGLNFSRNADIGQISHLWMGTS